MFTSFEKVLVLFSFLKVIFTWYRVLGWQFFPFGVLIDMALLSLTLFLKISLLCCHSFVCSFEYDVSYLSGCLSDFLFLYSLFTSVQQFDCDVPKYSFLPFFSLGFIELLGSVDLWFSSYLKHFYPLFFHISFLLPFPSLRSLVACILGCLKFFS